MDIFTILHTASQIYEVSGGIKERDPYGIIIPITSLTIVFIALIVLFLSYELIGRIIRRWFLKKQDGHFVVDNSINTSGNDIHDSESYAITIQRKGGPILKTVDRGIRITSGSTTEDETATNTTKAAGTSDGIVRSPLPGTILKFMVNEGDKVEIGQPVALLEAMKMENTIEAERNGTVTKIHVSPGDSVLESSEILTIE
jgi:biotin carboxyl carrier protein